MMTLSHVLTFQKASIIKSEFFSPQFPVRAKFMCRVGVGH